MRGSWWGGWDRESMATKRGEKEVPTQDGWREPPESLRVSYAELLPDSRPQNSKTSLRRQSGQLLQAPKDNELEGKGNHGKVYTKDDSYVIFWGR